MKPTLRPPRFFPEVLQAIYELRETGGSQVNKIANHVRKSVTKKSNRQRNRYPNMSVQVRKALKRGVEDGVLRYRAGKYRIDTRKKQIGDEKRKPLKDCAACRRAKRKREEQRRKQRRNKYRKGADFPDCDHRDGRRKETSVSEESQSRSRSPPVKKVKTLSTVEAKRAKRRAKSGKRRRGRKSKIGKQVASHNTNNNRKNQQNKIEDAPCHSSQPETYYMNKNFVYPDDLGQGDEDQAMTVRECDNPQCLCNSIKKEKGDGNPPDFEDDSDN